MKDVEITIKNYRNIPYNNPLRIILGEGITFILGVNNVGKSNFLKMFFELRGILLRGAIVPMNPNLTHNLPAFYSNIKNQKSPQDVTELHFKRGTRDIIKFNLTPAFEHTLEHATVNVHAHKLADDKEIDEVGKLFYDSLYVGAFRTPTFQTSGNYYDIQIGRSFIQVWDEWANGQSISKKNKISTLKEELKELFGFKRFNISTNTDNTNLNIETDDGTFTLDELGGGISHYILVLGNALIKEPSFIFIDEPETSLHPRMQEIFVRTLASKAKIGLIATSHSIGLARSVGADRIYSLTKDGKNRLNISNYGEYYKPSVANSISELGYSQFVEIGGNNILLVEGSGDIKSFREILRKYGIEQHFVIMSLGGSDLISSGNSHELEEIKRLNAKSVNVIFDSELTMEGEELKKTFKDFKDTCERLGFNVFPTDVHSTENYISQEALDLVFKESKYKVLDKYENFKNRGDKWGKSQNWMIFREMKKSDFEGTELHKFITNVLIPLTT